MRPARRALAEHSSQQCMAHAWTHWTGKRGGSRWSSNHPPEWVPFYGCFPMLWGCRPIDNGDVVRRLCPVWHALLNRQAHHWLLDSVLLLCVTINMLAACGVQNTNMHTTPGTRLTEATKERKADRGISLNYSNTSATPPALLPLQERITFDQNGMN